MKKYKISETLKKHIIEILSRRMILHELDTETSIVVHLDSEEFHKVVLRAKMEKYTEEKKSPIPYIAECELTDALVRQEKGNAFLIY